jgi:hypothetical protein
MGSDMGLAHARREDATAAPAATAESVLRRVRLFMEKPLSVMEM